MNNSNYNLVSPAKEYAQTLHAAGFTFGEFAEAYPNLANSGYGEELKTELEKLNK